MKKIFLVALLAFFSWQAEAQINDLTIEDVRSNKENILKFIEQDMNLLQEYVSNISELNLGVAKNLLESKYENLTMNYNEIDLPQEKIESFCHSLTERFKAVLGEDFEKVAQDPRVIRQLSGLSLFKKSGN